MGVRREEGIFRKHPMRKARTAPGYTPQVPPNPTVTFPFSTMTGTWRPPESRTIRSSSAALCLTLM
jgi:hypothetical protein